MKLKYRMSIKTEVKSSIFLVWLKKIFGIYSECDIFKTEYYAISDVKLVS